MILSEAMACGLPVVAGRCGGIPEVIQDGRTGLLVEPGDVDGLVEVVERIFDNRELSSRLGKAARTSAEDCFDWAKVSQEMMEVVLEK